MTFIAYLGAGARPTMSTQRARIGDATFQFDSNLVVFGTEEIRVTPKAMAVMRELCRTPGYSVTRAGLLETVWPGQFPTEEVVTQAIAELRKALERAGATGSIETIPRVGYRLKADVVWEQQRLGAEVHTPRALVADLRGLEDASRSAADRAGADGVPDRPDPVAASSPSASDDGSTLLGREGLPRGALRWRAILGGVALLGVLVAGATLIATARSKFPASSAVPRPLRPIALTADSQQEMLPALSPDGSMVAYTVNVPGKAAYIALLAVREDAQPIQLTDPSDSDYYAPVWSPDGRSIAYQLLGPNRRCAYEIVPVLGGIAREAGKCDGTERLRIFDWDADASALLVSDKERIHRLAVSTGRLEPIDSAQEIDRRDVDPRMSPDGRWIAFRRGAMPYSDLYVIPAGGGEARRVTSLASQILGHAWRADSRSLVFSSDHTGRQALYSVGLDGSGLHALGIEDAYFPSTARKADMLAYLKTEMRKRIAKLDLADGSLAGFEESSRSEYFPQFSADGRRVAFVSIRSGWPELWVRDTSDGGTVKQLTHLQAGIVGPPQWAPDGSELCFTHRGEGTSRLLRIQSDGRNIRQVGNDALVRFASYATDGSRLYASVRRNGLWKLVSYDLATAAATDLGAADVFQPRDFGDAGAVYYTKEVEPGLWRFDLGSGKESLVDPSSNSAVSPTYSVAAGRLYSLHPISSSSVLQICSVPVASIRASTLTARQFDCAGQWPDGIFPYLSVHASGRFALTVEIAETRTDVYAASLAEPPLPRADRVACRREPLGPR